jgi:phytoene dehydrogenase-like protein
MSKQIIVVGGGLAGLAAAVYLARGGHRVTLFERRRSLGGRAATHFRQGYRFNLGPHALYLGGAGVRVLRDLGVPLRGGRPPGHGTALIGGTHHRLPGSIGALAITRLLPLAAKGELAALMVRIGLLNLESVRSMSVRAWLDANTKHTRVHEIVGALIRLATYSADFAHLSAAAALRQLRLAIRHGVLYIDEGWQKIVDSLHSAALASGVSFVTSSRVVAVTHDGTVASGVVLGALEAERNDEDFSNEDSRDARGVPLRANAVLLAVDPHTASSLLRNGGPHDADWTHARAVTAACLDVALTSLPRPRKLFALGLDQPLYFSAHSAWAQLTPRGGALIHTARYMSEGDHPRTAEAELEQLLDSMQPGWREVVVHRRYLPSMIVSNALQEPDGSGRERPAATGSGLQNVFLAGDWVGDGGMLSDAALSSAQAAARAAARTS